MKKYTLTIGIPVFNEEKTIKNLLEDIQRQVHESYVLESIFVSSDGSTDNTIKIIKKMKHKKITLLENKKREGIARGINQIITKTHTDILVLLDGDIRLYDTYTLEKLIAPIISKKADLTSSQIVAQIPTTWVAKTLATSMAYKMILFDRINKGNNLYHCHGLARAFSKRFYTHLNFPLSIGNDMYSYLACVAKKMKFMYVPQAIAWYFLPETLIDHKKQSNRFYEAGKQQLTYFTKSLVAKELHIPFTAYLLSIFHSFSITIRHPFFIFSYIPIQIYTRQHVQQHQVKMQTWDIAESSKK